MLRPAVVFGEQAVCIDPMIVNFHSISEHIRNKIENVTREFYRKRLAGSLVCVLFEKRVDERLYPPRGDLVHLQISYRLVDAQPLMKKPLSLFGRLR